MMMKLEMTNRQVQEVEELSKASGVTFRTLLERTYIVRTKECERTPEKKDGRCLTFQ